MAKVGIYPAYLFKDHDPILDSVQTVIEDSGLTLTQVAEASHVSAGTLHNWWSRRTKKPQFATVAAVVRSLGADLVVVGANKKVIPLKVLKGKR